MTGLIWITLLVRLIYKVRFTYPFWTSWISYFFSVNLKEEKVRDIAEYELIIIGSGIQIYRWTSKAEGFLKQFSRELENKKVALFVSSGAQGLPDNDGDPEKIGEARRKYLEEKASKYNLHPISMGLFGGIWDYNNMPF